MEEKQSITFYLWKIQSTLKKHLFHLFEFPEVYFISDDNRQERLVFCQGIVTEENPDFFNNILWTYEASFCTRGNYNRKKHAILGFYQSPQSKLHPIFWSSNSACFGGYFTWKNDRSCILSTDIDGSTVTTSFGKYIS